MTLEAPHPLPPPALSAAEAESLADRYGLRALGERPPWRRYLHELWDRRSFLWTLSSAQSEALNRENRLGQLWAILNPVLLIASYFLIFGVLLSTRKGTTNYIAFLSIGVILFGITSSVVTRGARAIVNNTSLIRALRFPRAILPMSVAMTEFIANLPGFVVLMVLVLLTGETPNLGWLLFPFVVFFDMLILVGVALMGARIVNISRDLGNLIPVAIRILRYISGVFFSIQSYAGHGVAQAIMYYQPFALPLTTARQSLLTGSENAVRPLDFVYLALWGVGLFAVGLVVFWRDEARYGRG